MKLYRNHDDIEDEQQFVKDGSFDELSSIAVNMNHEYVVFKKENDYHWSYGFYSSDSFYKLGEIKN